MPLLDNLRKCVSRRQGLHRRSTKVLFNVKMCDSFKSPNLPSQLKDLLVYIARDGVAIADLFRRPGNPQDIRKIICDLENGRLIDWKSYSFYTLANIAKRYLLHIEGGVFGLESEMRMLKALESSDDQIRMEEMHSVIASQPKAVQHLLALLFGIWFRMIYHTEVNAMSVEAVAKSVAGSVFPNSITSPERVERASKVMEYLITGFASADLFSRELIEYFTTETQTSIARVEKFKYEFRFPKQVPREISVRLFNQLLQDESEKHGFDLVNDAVPKEIFDNASWGAYCPLNRSSADPLEGTVTGTPVLSVQRRLGNRQGNAFYRFSPETESALTKPGMPAISTRQIPDRSTVSSSWWDSPARDHGADPVQQLSEKHTCVTATPMREQSAPLPAYLNYAVPILTESRGPRWTNLANNYQSKDPALPSSQQQTVCFSSVKRRQLERLQQRSDWFLSPPAGLRSTGMLMQLDPNAKVVQHGQMAFHTIAPAPAANGENTAHLYPNGCAADVREPCSLNHGAVTVLDPTATSSPMQFPKSTRQDIEDKENFADVEVRYFVVERYYGPEPRNPRFNQSSKFVEAPPQDLLSPMYS